MDQWWTSGGPVDQCWTTTGGRKAITGCSARGLCNDNVLQSLSNHNVLQHRGQYNLLHSYQGACNDEIGKLFLLNVNMLILF